MAKFKFINGIANVHEPEACEGTFCCLHNPSDHPLRDWPMILRETALVERMCPICGTGHPDKDSAAYMNKLYGHPEGTWETHGCMGCCGGRCPHRHEI